MLEKACLLFTTIVTFAAIILFFDDRQLDFAVEKDAFRGFTKAVCMADGIVFGVTLSGVMLEFFQRFIREPIGHLATIAEIRYLFGLYSITVGTILSIFGWPGVTTLQVWTFCFVAIVNAGPIVRHFRRE